VADDGGIQDTHSREHRVELLIFRLMELYVAFAGSGKGESSWRGLSGQRSMRQAGDELSIVVV